MTDSEGQKRIAAREAAKLVQSGMHLGLGTGSTVAHFLDAVAERKEAEGLDLVCAATSAATERRAGELGLAVTPLDGLLDLAVDGADEVEFGTLDLVKGMGGALLREKQIAQSAHRFVVIADQAKLVPRLGARSRLPVEIVRFASERTLARLGDLGLDPALRGGAYDSFVTDNGNLVADCVLPAGIAPAALDAALRTVAGVVETGLFLGLCAEAVIGHADGSARRFEGGMPAVAGVAAMVATLRALRPKLPARKPLIAVMGVSASGKSTIGSMLAACLDVPFRDGDDLHPAANRAKMHAGVPLNDDDRMPWLHRIATELAAWRAGGCGGVMVSSLLTRRYRDLVRGAAPELLLVHLIGERNLLAERIAARHGHFMPASLLDSQFATLEPPAMDEAFIAVSVDASPIEIVRSVLQRLADG